MNRAEKGDEPPKVPSAAIGDDKKPPQIGDELASQDDREISAHHQLRNKKLAQQIKHIEAEHKARIKLLNGLYNLLRSWLTFLAGLLMLKGFLGSSEWVRFQLSEHEMLAVLGVTTVNVLGVFLVAAKYLFPKEPRWMDPTHPDRRSPGEAG